MYRASNIQYEHSDRVRDLASGGIGAMHRLVLHTGLAVAIDQRVSLLQAHLPYFESDHVLGIASTCCAVARVCTTAISVGGLTSRRLRPCRRPSPRRGGASGAPNPSSFSTKP